MPRIIVTTDPVSPTNLSDAAVLLSESVHSIHLSTEHAAGQLIERLAWAVTDAERAEVARRATRARVEHTANTRSGRRDSAANARAADPLAA